MNTKILKKLSSKITFRVNNMNTKPEYSVERKSKDSGEWEKLITTIRIERALIKKHNNWIAELHRMNYTAEIKNRRKFGKSAFFHKRRKRRSRKNKS